MKWLIVYQHQIKGTVLWDIALLFTEALFKSILFVATCVNFLDFV